MRRFCAGRAETARRTSARVDRIRASIIRGVSEEPNRGNGPGWAAKAGAYMGLAFVTPISGFLCYKAGEWLNLKLGLNYLDTAGLVFGCVVGMFETFRQAVRIEGIGRKK
jgi:hypothetical protein